MVYYPQVFLEQVRQSSDIVALIGEDTALKGRGDRFMGLCPFPEHSEKTPSFSVSQSKQVYYCFGCGNSGNIWTYLQKQRGMDFSSAVAYLSRKAGLTLPSRSSAQLASSNNISALFQLNEKVCQFYEDCLKNLPATHSVRVYLKKRGWSEETVKNFRLGYAPEGGALAKILTPQEIAYAEQLGLFNQSQEGQRYENFRQRLIFPIISIRRQVVGFGARVLDDSLPKYINSKESPIFHKGRVFYGLHESARYIREKGLAFVVEGYTDFLSLREAGFLNVVAVLGTALTEHHALILKRYTETAVLLFDGDEAGFKACERSLPALLGKALEVKFVSFPEGLDPDGLVRKNGKQAFEACVRQAHDLFLFLMEKRRKKLKAEGQEDFHLLEEMAPLLVATTHPILKELYKNRLLDLFGTEALIMEKALSQRMKELSRKLVKQARLGQKTGNPLPSSVVPKTKQKVLDAEKWLLTLCLESENFFQQFLKNDILRFLKTQAVVEIFEEMEKAYKKNPDGFDELLHVAINKSKDPGLIFEMRVSTFHSAPAEAREKLFKDSVQHLKARRNRQEAGEWIEKIKKEGGNLHHLEKVFQLTRQRLKAGQKN